MDENKYYIQIDYLKAIAIIFVIILHTFPEPIWRSMGFIFLAIYNFIVLQAVPIFSIILGLNAGASFKRRDKKLLNNLYSKEYVKTRFTRFLVPFIFIFILSAIIGILFKKKLYFGLLNLIGYLPVEGAGNYFIVMVFQFLVIFPLIYYLYKKSPNLILISSFFLSIIYVLVANFYPIFTQFYILNYLFLISLGIWMLENLDLDNLVDILKNKIILAGFFMSILIMVLLSIPYFMTYKIPIAFVSFYTLIFCIFGFKIFPPSSKTRIQDHISLIGKASYHIFLVQMLFFGFLGIGFSISSFIGVDNSSLFGNLLKFVFNISICLILGILFYIANRKLKIRI